MMTVQAISKISPSSLLALISLYAILLFGSLLAIVLYVTAEAYHLEAFNFPYTFETMLRIIPDQ